MPQKEFFPASFLRVHLFLYLLHFVAILTSAMDLYAHLEAIRLFYPHIRLFTSSFSIRGKILRVSRKEGSTFSSAYKTKHTLQRNFWVRISSAYITVGTVRTLYRTVLRMCRRIACEVLMKSRLRAKQTSVLYV